MINIDGLDYWEYILLEPLPVKRLKHVLNREMKVYNDSYMTFESFLFKLSPNREWVDCILRLDFSVLPNPATKEIEKRQMNMLRYILCETNAMLIDSEDASYVNYGIMKEKLKMECIGLRKRMIENYPKEIKKRQVLRYENRKEKER